jgi:hypothetical protein
MLSTSLLTMVTHYTDESVDQATVWNGIIDAAETKSGMETEGEGTRTATTIKVEERSSNGLSVSPIARD